MSLIWPAGSTAVLTAIAENANGAAVDGATATITLVNAAGEPLDMSGVSWPADMSGAGSGRYTYALDGDHADAVAAGERVYAEITIEKGAERRFARIRIHVVTDTD